MALHPALCPRGLTFWTKATGSHVLWPLVGLDEWGPWQEVRGWGDRGVGMSSCPFPVKLPQAGCVAD